MWVGWIWGVVITRYCTGRVVSSGKCQPVLQLRVGDRGYKTLSCVRGKDGDVTKRAWERSTMCVVCLIDR